MEIPKRSPPNEILVPPVNWNCSFILDHLYTLKSGLRLNRKVSPVPPTTDSFFGFFFHSSVVKAPKTCPFVSAELSQKRKEKINNYK